MEQILLEMIVKHYTAPPPCEQHIVRNTQEN